MYGDRNGIYAQDCSLTRCDRCLSALPCLRHSGMDGVKDVVRGCEGEGDVCVCVYDVGDCLCVPAYACVCVRACVRVHV